MNARPILPACRNTRLKAAHEAKGTHELDPRPNEPYEQATRDFIAAILAGSTRNLFLADFEPFARRIADLGIWNSLSQTLLKLTSPGVPDIYQGTELFDFRLVDPDNRGPVLILCIVGNCSMLPRTPPG